MGSRLIRLAIDMRPYATNPVAGRLDGFRFTPVASSTIKWLWLRNAATSHARPRIAHEKLPQDEVSSNAR
jgi:hypothetical protein